jgi:hypothetical protein
MENTSSDSGVKFDTVVSENQNSITLSKDDFQTILNVLVVVSKRGGFLLEEYKVVGELFDRLKVLSN